MDKTNQENTFNLYNQSEVLIMSRQQLHTLIDTIDEKDIDLLQALLLKFIPSDIPLPDEIEAIKQGEADFKNKDIYTHDEVWG